MIQNRNGELCIVLDAVENLPWPYHDSIALDPMACDILMSIAFGVKMDFPDLKLTNVIHQAYEAFQAAMEVR